MSNPFECLTDEQYTLLENFIDNEFSKVDEPNLDHLTKSGVLFPDRLPHEWDTLPDEWDRMMENQGIVNLEDHELSKYLEKWLRLLGYAYWVRGIREANFNILERCANYVKDYVFAHAQGGREQKSAVAGSHPLYRTVLERLTVAQEQLFTLNGMIYKWEKIEFSISRAITNRAGRPSR
ncbi:hypothetical protein ACR6EC_12205 [Bacillus subtilis]|uniref:hypothetical protein n=1 Tax=Bacillus subtilis TaxID=1423 RepID=UPI000A102815|nr:hypothetical protein [Bacillus subtilis]MEC2266539.1 hypothetical protein [Bacillus subtilis]MEC4031897.1 hypothetical protein [Bacillus subtilis]MUG00721.1 hypothetical protein [Bacillus tequilensis]